ncbi:transposase IS4 family protein [Burkholderia contaminans]|nr:transposase IS4 family protein [Burkholderia contaminans]
MAGYSAARHSKSLAHMIRKSIQNLFPTSPAGEGLQNRAFHVIKRQFGYLNVCYRGLMTNTQQVHTFFAPNNPWTARE